MIKLRQIVNQNILDFSTEQKYHAIISDPPYGLAFMNKGWDSFKKPIDYQKWVTDWSSHLMQFLYPGTVCAFFGGTRTYHRLASGLEDAGYEIFDSMIWCYGSGFPKSYNISKGIDKSLGLEREIIGKGISGKTAIWQTEGGMGNFSITKSNSDLATTWNGYGTALKPAYEPIVLCRKPLDKGGYVNSVLEYGTGGLNIDGGRIDTNWDNDPSKRGFGYGFNSDNFDIQQIHLDNQSGNLGLKPYNWQPIQGRFPANFGLICTCEKEPCECIESELDKQSGLLKSGELNNQPKQKSQVLNSKLGGIMYKREKSEGGASRFFYTAKASSKERELGLEGLDKNYLTTLGNGLSTHNPENEKMYRHNNHPTVKPIKLIEYLATLLLPPIENSSILIPFSGVGSEMIGSYFAGWQNITGIEVDKNYCEIANKRLDYWTQFEDYKSAMKNKTNPQTSYEDTLVAK